MVSRHLSFGSVGAALVLPAMALAQGEGRLVLNPASSWNVNYADDSCRLGRAFGEGNNRAVLIMDRFAPSDSFELSVASGLLTRTAAASDGKRKVTIRFGPGESEQEKAMRPATLLEMPALVGAGVVLGVRTDEALHEAEVSAARALGDEKKLKALEVLKPVAPLTPEREGAVSFLEIRGASRQPIVLATGKMDKPMAALRTCIDELLTHWGINAEAHKSLTRAATPQGNPGRWVSSDDYPSNLIARGVQGIIQFRLTIEADGNVGGCAIQQSTRPAAFDDAVCRIMSKRARFDPALDAAGNPIKSYWRSSFAFIIQ